MKNRLGIYFFYDKDGIVDDYVFYFLKSLKKVTNKIIFIANGHILQEYSNLLNSIVDKLYIKENKGFDAFAYKYVFDNIGWDEASKYDEVVLCNSTFLGPIFSLEDMFLKMDERENLDFWGITQHPDYLYDTENIPAFNINPYGYLPKHIQYYFVVYRNKLLRSNELHEFYKSLPTINEYFDTVGLFETVFTKRFEDLGYKWDTYIKYDENNSINYPLLYKPYEMITKYNCPILKKKSFYLENELTIKYNTKEQVDNVIKYLKDNNLYDVNLILKSCYR